MSHISQKWWCILSALLLILSLVSLHFLNKPEKVETQIDNSSLVTTKTPSQLKSYEPFTESTEIKNLRYEVLGSHVSNSSENAQEKNTNERIANLENTIKELSN
ncbi:hypothetical protein [Vibrio owensii]|uniref:hypothetical protein n=1 Tax=Vibrio owensii TaxID=696485 RepID=UPI00221FF886|nr:hypothetical protein [Vibrio owensii]